MVLEDFFRPAECDEMLEAGKELAKNLPTQDQRIVFTSVDAENRVSTYKSQHDIK